LEQLAELLPGEMRLLAPTAEPLVPGPLRFLGEHEQAAKVPAHAEVVEVALDASRERGVLHLDRQVSMATTPVRDVLYRPSQACMPSLARHPPSAAPSALPVQREPEEVEGDRTLAAPLRCRRSPERQQARLVRVEGQPESNHPLAEHIHHALRVFLQLERHCE